ncbi:MAG: hypothetical protein V4573_14095 [Pseudomonadota bacterium]
MKENFETFGVTLAIAKHDDGDGWPGRVGDNFVVQRHGGFVSSSFLVMAARPSGRLRFITALLFCVPGQGKVALSSSLTMKFIAAYARIYWLKAVLSSKKSPFLTNFGTKTPFYDCQTAQQPENVKSSLHFTSAGLATRNPRYRRWPGFQTW